jgi:serine/threonine-protein kinase
MSQAPKRIDDLKLIRQIATGGMAELWEGVLLGTDGFEKQVAIKKLLPHLAHDQEFTRLFLNEAQIAAKLHHSNICQIYKLGQFEGTHYIVMEYIQGWNVTEVLRKAAKAKHLLPLSHVCLLVSQLCSALDYAHKRTDEHGQPLHIVHRDLSPPNIMLTHAGYVKVIDFGIAKAASQIHHTPADIMRGKFAYMSPEYILDEPLDAQSDVFSIGIVFWELLTGRRLFHAETEYAKMAKISQGNYPSPQTYRSDLPPMLESIVMKALSPQKENRFASCGKLLDAIEQFVFGHPCPTTPRYLAKHMTWLFAESTAPPPQLPTISHAQTNTTSQLPTPSPTPTSEPTWQRPNAPAYTHRILIVDDYEEARDTLALILSSHGFDIETASTGEQAVQLIKQTTFDACLIDLTMPGQGGRETLKQIKQLRPSLPCIIQTAQNSVQTAAELGRIGAASYLVKPIPNQELLHTVKQHVVARPEHDALEEAILTQYPTPFATWLHTYQQIPDHPQFHQQKLTQLATLFEMQTSWLGALALAEQTSQGTTPSSIKQLLQQHINTLLGPSFWLMLFQRVIHHQIEHNEETYSHQIRHFLYPPTPTFQPKQNARQQLLDTIVPLLKHHTSPHAIELPFWPILLQYHQQLWRHSAQLSDAETQRLLQALEPFLRVECLQHLYPLLDFDIVYTDPHTHPQQTRGLTTLRGLTPSKRTEPWDTAIQPEQVYLFERLPKLRCDLFPFVHYQPATATHDMTGDLAVLLKVEQDGTPLYRSFLRGQLYTLPDHQEKQAKQRLQALFG